MIYLVYLLKKTRRFLTVGGMAHVAKEGGMAPPGPLLLTDIGESAIVKKINKQASRTKKHS